MVIDLKTIKPNVKNESDKYSWNLYKFLNKLFKTKDRGKYIQKQLEIHWLHHSRWNGKYLDFDPEKLDTMQLLILPLGRGNSRSFYSMNSIITRGRAEEFALPWSYEDSTDITEWFFNTYQRDGRCIFDREHGTLWMLGDQDRFTYINNTRKCKWCGKWQHKEIEKEVKINRRAVWIAQ